VVRFDRAKRLLRSPGRPTLAEIAAVCGYYVRWIGEDELAFVHDGRD
jgi:hypothetical protein